jgi:small subunit ribosomal protein S2
MNISLRDLLEAGVHFGHQTGRWNPKMKPYIYGAKDGVHVIDLQQTARGLVGASRFVTSTVESGKHILFVGTKRAAREIISEEALRCGMFFVNHRWLGGTMTNWQTVKKSIERLVKLERARDEGKFEVLTKKEALELTREIEKMDRNLGGIKNMKGLPAAIFVVDPKKEHIAIREANTLGIPVVGLCDTNCDPTGIDYVIPGNDDALKSVRLFTAAIADAVLEGRQRSTGRHAQAAYVSDADQAAAPAFDVVNRGGFAAAEAEAEPVAEADAGSEAPEAVEG